MLARLGRSLGFLGTTHQGSLIWLAGEAQVQRAIAFPLFSGPEWSENAKGPLSKDPKYGRHLSKTVDMRDACVSLHLTATYAPFWMNDSPMSSFDIAPSRAFYSFFVQNPVHRSPHMVVRFPTDSRFHKAPPSLARSPPQTHHCIIPVECLSGRSHLRPT